METPAQVTSPPPVEVPKPQITPQTTERNFAAEPGQKSSLAEKQKELREALVADGPTLVDKVLELNEIAVGEVHGGLVLAQQLHENYRIGVSRANEGGFTAERSFCLGRTSDIEDLLIREFRSKVVSDSDLETEAPKSQPVLHTGQYL